MLFAEGKYSSNLCIRYNFYRKVGGIIRRLLPTSALNAHEESWNAFPYTRTIITVRNCENHMTNKVGETIDFRTLFSMQQNEYLGSNFFLKIESLHLPGNANRENVHRLSKKKLKNVEVVFIDIAADLNNPHDYSKSKDPRIFKSKKTGRGRLTENWMETVNGISINTIFTRMN